jgi:hypothetical protein
VHGNRKIRGAESNGHKGVLHRNSNRYGGSEPDGGSKSTAQLFRTSVLGANMDSWGSRHETGLRAGPWRLDLGVWTLASPPARQRHSVHGRGFKRGAWVISDWVLNQRQRDIDSIQKATVRSSSDTFASPASPQTFNSRVAQAMSC